MSSLVPKKNSAEKDIVYTPRYLARKVVTHFMPSGRVLEPCYGNGAFYDVFPQHTKRYWCEIAMGKDFLTYTRKVDWVISNPPWSKFKEFMIHAMTLADNIVYVVTINHFITKQRLRLIRAANFGIVEFVLLDTPKTWPQSGFQVVAGYLRKGYTGSINIVDFQRKTA